MLIAEEEHERDWIVEFVHLLEIGDLVEVADIDNGEVFDEISDFIKNLIHTHAVWVPVTAEADDYQSLVFGQDRLINVPCCDKMRNDDGTHIVGFLVSLGVGGSSGGVEESVAEGKGLYHSSGSVGICTVVCVGRWKMHETRRIKRTFRAGLADAGEAEDCRLMQADAGCTTEEIDAKIKPGRSKFLAFYPARKLLESLSVTAFACNELFPDKPNSHSQSPCPVRLRKKQTGCK